MPINFNKMPITKMKPQPVVRAALNGLGKKISVVPGKLNQMYVWENRLLPRWAPIKLFGFLVRWAFKKECRDTYLIPKRRAR